MAATAPVCDFGWSPPPFRLPGTDGQMHALASLSGPKGTLVMFICNHCPYVLGALDRIVRDARDLSRLGIGVAAISSNDATAYPEDSFEKMTTLAIRHGFPFAYLYDESQEVARAWGAACTPDFFGFNARMQLQYRGRIDAAGPRPAPADTRRELYEAMAQIARTGKGPDEQTPSMGCSIKWKAA